MIRRKSRINLFIFLIFIGTMVMKSSCGADNPGGGETGPDEPYVNTVFRDDFNESSIDASVWQVATWTEHGGLTGAARCYTSDGYLNMIFINDADLGYLSAALQTREEFYYGTWEARLKPSSVPGVLNSFYTIDWDNTATSDSESDGTKQEIDIEFLTYTFSQNTGTVHVAVHESGKESFETHPDVALDFNPSDDFHTWGFEITPDYIRWFVDNTNIITYTYDGNPIAISTPYQLKLNVWSSEHWVNGPPVENTPCVYQIDWIQFTPLHE